MLQIGLFMFKLENNLLPCLFENFFTKSSDIHSHNLRTLNNFRPDFAHTTTKLFSIKCSGPRNYSDIPASIKSSKTLSLFKKEYKSYLLRSWRLSSFTSFYIYRINNLIYFIYSCFGRPISGKTFPSDCPFVHCFCNFFFIYCLYICVQ